MKPTHLFVVATVLTVALGLVACSDDDEPSLEESRANLCADLDAFRTATQNLRALSGETTLGEFEAARDEASDAWSDVESSAVDVQDARVDDLQAAYNGLDAAIADVDSDASLAAALGSISGEVAAVDAAWDEYYATAGCVTSPTRPAATVGVTEVPPTEAGPPTN